MSNSEETFHTLCDQSIVRLAKEFLPSIQEAFSACYFANQTSSSKLLIVGFFPEIATWLPDKMF